ncbi:MAG: conjugal transfer protein TraN, partial [Novosphingobium sp.]|nr:conjugal transfer protein TraN [Novosphingobium sp.]
MSRFALAFFLATALPCFAQAQTTTDAAKADGKAFGKDIGAAAQSAATTQPNADRVPGYSGTPSQSGYFDDPKAMERAAASQASANTGYQTMRNSSASRATFSKVDLDAAIARSKTISEDPLSYTSGMTVGGTQGRCVLLPPASGTAARYKATCNTGYTVDSSTQSCTVTLQASVTTVTDYLYYCPKLDPECTAFDLATCRLTGSHPGKCLQGIDTPTGYKCFEPGDPIAEYTCSEPVAGLTPIRVTPRQVVTTTRDESQCASLAADANCTSPVETCSDSDPVTRTIDGYSITQPCWAWRRDYQCNRFTPAQDCTTLEQTPGCNLEQEYCLTDETPCRTFERVYDCPVPDQPQDPNQFICDGDVYCIDGSCETIQRQPNTEFKDAVVALNAMDQARREFDPNNLTLFKGTR